MQRYVGIVNAMRTRAATVMETPVAQGLTRGARIVFAPVIAVGGAYSAIVR